MKFILIAAMASILSATATLAASPYPTPTRDGRERLTRTGSCPTGYVGKAGFCEAHDRDTPRAYPKIDGSACPSGTFRSGDYCKAFR